MDAFMEDNFFGDPILKIFQGSKYMATKADIWRLCILHKFGGLYLDIDSTIKFNLEETLAGRSEYLSFAGDTLHSEIDPLEFPEDIFFSNRKKIIDNSLLHPDHMVLNWCMFFKKEHPILQIALDDIRNNALHYWDREFNNTRRAVIHLAGPMSLTRAIWRYVESGYKPDQETFDFADSAIFKAIGRHSVYFAQDHYTIGTHKRILQTDLLEHSK
jgi:mannosyltransferase OCH1-like enzyme